MILSYFSFLRNNSDGIGFVNRGITNSHFPGAEVDRLLLDVKSNRHFIPHFEKASIHKTHNDQYKISRDMDLLPEHFRRIHEFNSVVRQQ